MSPSTPTSRRDPRHLLVVIPNWVGDVVMATPVLAALRRRLRHARITYLCRPYVREVLAGAGWHDHEIYWPTNRGLAREWQTVLMTQRVRVERIDCALLLTNSFRSASAAWLARIPRRIGYGRDGRSWLLTDRVKPLRANGRYVPAPVLDAYSRLAEHLGCRVTDRRLRLSVPDEQERAGQALKAHYGLDDGEPYAVINPGAKFGAAKCWLPERFAEVCDRLREQRGWRSVIVGAPNEIPLMREIRRLSLSGPVCCDEPGTTLGSLKVVIRDAGLLVCNDTGPRHYGNAFRVPTVTIFGPTHQEWTDHDYDGEVKVQVPVDCGPCQLPVCPLDLRCMIGVTTDLVMEKIEALLGRPAVCHCS